MTTSAQAPTQLEAAVSDEIDLRELVGTLQRRWRLIAASASAGVVLAGLATQLQPKVWEGEFQIVLAGEKQGGTLSSLLAQNAGLAAVAGLGGLSGGSSSQETEVKILESPSVLLPVFEWVKARQPTRQSKNLRFHDWVDDAIEVKAEKGTSVLNIRYRDTHKQLVLPVTQLISQTYQDYSGRARRQELSNVIRYLETQITQLTSVAKASSREAQAYASEYGLAVIDGLPVSAGVNTPTNTADRSTSIEARRTAAQQRITALQLQLNQARTAGNQLLYIASETASRNDKSSTFDALTVIESLLAEKRSRLRPGDPIVQRLERERTALIGYINNQTVALLEGELAVARSNLNALERPKAVIERHRELTQKALRDEASLVEFQNNLARIKLEEARKTDPWDLISTPTLLERPVSPRPARNLALGLLAGLVAGSGVALVTDRRSGVVFSTKELQQLLPYPLLAQLDAAEPSSWATSLQLLAQGALAGQVRVALIAAGALDPAQTQALARQLQTALEQLNPGAQLLQSNDLSAAACCDAQLLLARPGCASRQELVQLHQNLQLQGQVVTGMLLLVDAC